MAVRNELRPGALTSATDLAFDKLRQGVCVFDGEHHLVLFNRRYAEIYSLEAADLRIGMLLRDVVDLRFAAGTGPQMTPEQYRLWREQIAVAKDAAETIVHLQDGRAIEIHHEPTDDGGWVSTHDDITDRMLDKTRVAASEARLRALTDALPQMVWVAGASDSVTGYTNRRFRDYLGAIGPTREDRIGNHHPEDRERAKREWAIAEAEGRTFEIEERWCGADGAYRWHKTILTPVRHEGRVIEWLGTALDIDDIVNGREALRKSEERLSLALDAGSDGLWDCDVVSGAAWLSDRAQTMLGYDPGELKAHAGVWRKLVHPEDRSLVNRNLAEHMKGRSAVYECEHRLRRKDGGWGWVLARGKVVRDAHGRPHRFVGTHIDISARKMAEGRVDHLTRHDGLTDLPNRTLFRERLDQRLADVRRYGGSCAVLCLDLDGFKAVNETLGHLAGDALLREVAMRIRSVVRSEDTIGRLGGDEFAVLLGGGSGPSAVAALARRLIACVQSPVGEYGAEVGLSIGVAVSPDHGLDGEALLKRADLALHRAKADGGNSFLVFEPAMDMAASERLGLERDLRRAVAEGELTLYYQPQVAARTGELVGFEALVRWHHPTRGLVSPADFIPLAEECGLIVPLGEWVLRSACREAARWADHLKVAVNLSPRQFQQAELPELVLGILIEAGLPPTRLELEITESVIINDMARALGILRRLKALGIRIAMDDFGTGYSSLATLQAFPFDKIKIDRSFVGKIEESAEAAVIVRAVLGLGRSLRMGIVAEGVETPEQMRFLVDENCDELQGYLLGRPMPIDQLPSGIYAENRVGALPRHGDPAPRPTNGARERAVGRRARAAATS